MSRWERTGLLNFIAGCTLVMASSATDFQQWLGFTVLIIGGVMFLYRRDTPHRPTPTIRDEA